MGHSGQREFEFGPAEFEALRGRILHLTGITLSDRKETMVYSRLARRIRQMGLRSFRDYVAVLDGADGAEELVNFVNALTTNLTHFFREKHHFQHLRAQVLKPRILGARQGLAERRLRIWSAGCSTGQEPYSLAMTILASVSGRDRFDARILATDIDTSVLAKARDGLYDASSATGIPPALRSRFVTERADGRVKMSPVLRRIIAFRQMNLTGDWPKLGQFDAIMCRNVMIYFSRETQRSLVQKFVRHLVPGGVLYVGHAESLVADKCGLNAVGQSTFVKPGALVREGQERGVA